MDLRIIIIPFIQLVTLLWQKKIILVQISYKDILMFVLSKKQGQ